MIVYACICGSKITVDDNTEKTRDIKRKWKAKHRGGRKNPGHAYQRNAVRRSTK